ncbi:CAP domain-containing protein [candidate division KSB1 bacterium]|nr:CAP domain-containing protein [candidate division KSB1 bacterium]
MGISFHRHQFGWSICILVFSIGLFSPAVCVDQTGNQFLSQLEQDVVAENNRARQNPHQFATYLEQRRAFYIGKQYKPLEGTIIRTKEGLRAVDEAIRFLRNATPLQSLEANEGLSRAAKDHVDDQSVSGKTGHIGSDGSEPFERLKRYGTIGGFSGENISYGLNAARGIVISLIIDDDVPSRGHRKLIFTREFQQVGVACGYHPIFQHMCVITFASTFSQFKHGSMK